MNEPGNGEARSMSRREALKKMFGLGVGAAVAMAIPGDVKTSPIEKAQNDLGGWASRLELLGKGDNYSTDNAVDSPSRAGSVAYPATTAVSFEMRSQGVGFVAPKDKPQEGPFFYAQGEPNPNMPRGASTFLGISAVETKQGQKYLTIGIDDADTGFDPNYLKIDITTPDGLRSFEIAEKDFAAWQKESQSAVFVPLGETNAPIGPKNVLPKVDDLSSVSKIVTTISGPGKAITYTATRK